MARQLNGTNQSLQSTTTLGPGSPKVSVSMWAWGNSSDSNWGTGQTADALMLEYTAN